MHIPDETGHRKCSQTARDGLKEVPLHSTDGLCRSEQERRSSVRSDSGSLVDPTYDDWEMTYSSVFASCP